MQFYSCTVLHYNTHLAKFFKLYTGAVAGGGEDGSVEWHALNILGLACCWITKIILLEVYHLQIITTLHVCH